ncbi:hypothetical protein SBDP1_150011 [Syntrophobacter sp. SbD1]|nr:hypothetical protein SBDP1_150011 [Syntrophobacter sp. SbD1]
MLSSPMRIPFSKELKDFWTGPHAKENFGWQHITVRIADSEQSMIATPGLFWAGYGDCT